MTTAHVCLRSGMSLLGGGQGVSGCEECSTCAGRSDGPIHSKAAQLEPYTGGEKSDSFFSQPPAQGISRLLPQSQDETTTAFLYVGFASVWSVSLDDLFL